jgi:hypothetical protein
MPSFLLSFQYLYEVNKCFPPLPSFQRYFAETPFVILRFLQSVHISHCFGSEEGTSRGIADAVLPEPIWTPVNIWLAASHVVATFWAMGTPSASHGLYPNLIRSGGFRYTLEANEVSRSRIF